MTTPTASPTTSTAPDPSGPAPRLRVSGNKILTTDGQQYRLLGVSRSSGEFACVQGKGLWDSGPVDQASVEAMKTWNIHAVRPTPRGPTGTAPTSTRPARSPCRTRGTPRGSGPASPTNESCWDSQIAPLAQQVPVVLGEFGQDNCGFDYMQQLVTWADAHDIGYLGWTWNPWGCTGGAVLIKDVPWRRPRPAEAISREQPRQGLPDSAVVE